MSVVVVVELVLGFLVLLALAAVVVLWVRRRYIGSEGRTVVLCARRKVHTTRWRLGLARLGADHLEWFSIVGPSWRPELTWPRGLVDFGAPRSIADPIPGLFDPVAVAGRTTTGAYCDFAFTPAAYTAVRSWLESSPPGYHSNVA
ncbi:MAG: DUF2550 family protein [Dermatophilaceae bacterium]